MAAESREDRRLMRQRGAGVRELKTASFGFTFGPGEMVISPAGKRQPHQSPGPYQAPSVHHARYQHVQSETRGLSGTNAPGSSRSRSPQSGKQAKATQEPLLAQQSIDTTCPSRVPGFQAREIKKASTKGVPKLLQIDEGPAQSAAQHLDRPKKRSKTALARVDADMYHEPISEKHIRDPKPGAQRAHCPTISTNVPAPPGELNRINNKASTSATRMQEREAYSYVASPRKKAGKSGEKPTTGVSGKRKRQLEIAAPIKPRSMTRAITSGPLRQSVHPPLDIQDTVAPLEGSRNTDSESVVAAVDVNVSVKNGRPRKANTSAAPSSITTAKSSTRTKVHIRSEGNHLAQKTMPQAIDPEMPRHASTKDDDLVTAHLDGPIPRTRISDSVRNRSIDQCKNAARGRSTVKQSPQRSKHVISARLASMLRDSDDDLLRSSDDEKPVGAPVSTLTRAQVPSVREPQALPDFDSEPCIEQEDQTEDRLKVKSSAKPSLAARDKQSSQRKESVKDRLNTELARPPLFRRTMNPRLALSGQTRARGVKQRKFAISSDISRSENDASELEQNSYLDHFPEPKIPDTLVAKTDRKLKFRM